MNIGTTIGLSALLTAVLMQVFQFLKVYVLTPYVPGFAANDASSNRNLRIVFYVLTLAMLVVEVLSGAAGVSIPGDITGRVTLAYVLINSAGIFTAAAHVVYDTSMSKGSGSDASTATSAPADSSNSAPTSAPTDFPVGAPSSAFGLPTVAATTPASSSPVAPAATPSSASTATSAS